MATDLSEKIIEWVKGRTDPDWQIALLQLVAQGETITNEIVENFASHAIVDEVQKEHSWFKAPEIEVAELSPSISVDDFGVRSETANPVLIHQIKHIKGVNALKDGASLTFEKEGLSIVYGHNGSGKSGFTRILKQFAASRGPETIVPNALVGGNEASAKVTFNVGTDVVTSEWNGGPSLVNGSLNRVRVFDAVSARSHISNSIEVGYVPPQLEVLSSMVELLGRVKETIEDRQRNTPMPPARWSAIGDEEFTALVEMLGTKEGKEAVKAIEVFSEEDSERLRKLEADLAKLKSNSPQKIAAQLMLHANQIAGIANSLRAAQNVFSSDNRRQLSSLIQRVTETTKMVESQGSDLSPYDLLDGLSDPNWGDLWESAIKFHNSRIGNPDNTVELHNADRCPLCQQELSDESKRRLKAFMDFRTSELSTRLENAKKALGDFRRTIEAVPIRSAKELQNDVDLIQLYAQVENDSKGCLYENLLRVANQEIEGLKNGYLREIELLRVPEGESDSVSSVSERCGDVDSSLSKTISLIESLIATIKAEAAEYQLLTEHSSSDSNISNEILTLQRKELLAKEKEFLEEHHDLEALRDAIAKAVRRCSSQAYTKLTRDLSSHYVGEIGSAFEDELGELGFDSSIPVKLQFDKAQKGVSLIRVVYNDYKRLQVDRILSEGEQRVISLAGFFADLSNTGDLSALVFDDPVSSLDHRFRKAVAMRLVKDSVRRQVLVFTHDDVFVRLLEESRRDLNLRLAANGEALLPEISELEIVRTDDGAGVHPPVDWRRRKLKDQIGQLKSMAQSLKAQERKDPDNYPQNARVLLSAVRESWERVVEERLLNSVVSRFGRDVQTKRLAPLHDITHQDIARVDLGMTIESRLMTGHSTPAAVSPERFPSSDEVYQEVKNLEDFYKDLSARGRS